MNKSKLFEHLSVLFGLCLFAGIVIKSQLFCSQVSAFCATENSAIPASIQIAPQYFTFSQTKLSESLDEHHIVVLYFYAPWCSTCTSFDQELKNQHGQLPQNVDVLQIDYDSAFQLKKQYSVTYQHTIVLLDQQGKVREMWIGGDLNALLDYLKKNP